jgi:hypothetical protein
MTVFPLDLDRLFTDSKFLNDVFVTLSIVRFQIVQQATALADHHKKTPPGGMVLFMALEVLRQLADTLTENGNLDFRAARIRLMRTEAVDDVGLALSR